MYQLYYYPGNANLAPHMVLEEIGAEHQLILVDRDHNAQKSAEYLKLNPSGRIPVLINGDQVLYETAAICLHLADTHPDAGLVPELASAERAQCYKWLMYLTNTLQSEMLCYFYPERWSDNDAAAAQVKTHAEQHIAEMFDIIEAALAEHGGPYLLGERYSILDPYLLMLARWSRGMTHPARQRQHIDQLLQTVAARPAVQRAFAAEGLEQPFY